jgi:hypothetical protein
MMEQSAKSFLGERPGDCSPWKWLAGLKCFYIKTTKTFRIDELDVGHSSAHYAGFIILCQTISPNSTTNYGWSSGSGSHRSDQRHWSNHPPTGTSGRELRAINPTDPL